MYFKKLIMISILFFQVFCNSSVSLAAPQTHELNQYLAQLGWTKEQLMDYLSYYEIPLDKINSVENLKNVLGTPINKENYQQLLTKYNLTDKELQVFLNKFGDSLDRYKFIEDLNTALGFYTNHNDFMAGIKSNMAKLRITEQEVEKLFRHLSQVEETNKAQLDKIQLLDNSMEKFLIALDPADLTNSEIDELVKLLTEALDLYDIRVKFKLNNKNITLDQLLKMSEPPGNLYTAIYNKQGILLMDFIIPADFFQGILIGWDEILHLGELANEFVDYLHNEKFNNLQEYK